MKNYRQYVLNIINDLYFRLFGEKNKIEIISMHIPKTAGISFRHILKENYGKQLCLLYGKNKKIKENRGYRVIHGHFYIRKFADQYPKARYILWVRNPIERINSLYNFWLNHPKHKNILHDRFLMEKMSIIELAMQNEIKDEMRSYIQGFGLDRFFFIGVVENFDEDIRILSNKLEWRIPKITKMNQNKSKRKLSSYEINQLKRILKEEIDFYNEVIFERNLHHLRI